MRRTLPSLALSLPLLAAAACGGDDAPDDNLCTAPPGPFAAGDDAGHADPLGAGPTEARAGRLAAEDLPAGASKFLTWKPGDFVLANDKVALVIEDVGHSDLYDPWGGRPVGMALVSGGAMVSPADYGEQFFLTGRSTVATTSVTVLNDGSDGQPAVIRAAGRLAPLPFLDPLLTALFFDPLYDMEAALDYVLAPGAEVVEVYFRLGSPRPVDTDAGSVLHGLMYARRMAAMVPGKGFTENLSNALWVQLVDDDGASWAYQPGEGDLGSSLAQAGFVGALTSTFNIARCGVTDRLHGRIVIGGPGLDGLEQARARFEGRTLRTITGTVTDGTSPRVGVRVHAEAADSGYASRVTTDATGAFTLHVPDGEAVTLTAYERGWLPATSEVAATASSAAITMAPVGAVHVTVQDATGPVPARVQLLPAGATELPTLPEEFGEPEVVGGRLHTAFPVDGDVTLPVPPGDWRVVVSRGFEYELFDTDVTVTAGETVALDVVLDRVVDTAGEQCGDFHIHTLRSNDAEDDGAYKVASAVADGLELPVRTDHEWVNSFAEEIEALGVEPWAYAIGSVEMTSFQIWGHMNILPLEADPTKPNAGSPEWQVFPDEADPGREVVTKSPKVVFEEVRARPERPTIIINHPRGSTEYFGYVGFDAATGLIERPEHWDEEFTLVEVFNDSSWLANRDGTVRDWFGLLALGRPVFAVGNSDSHAIKGTPVGYPRTCIEVGTDDPRQLTADLVRDNLAAGHTTVSGGVYLDVAVGAAGPGDTAAGVTATADVSVTVQAASWVDVDAIDVVVDGETVETIAIDPADAVAGTAIRWQGTIPVDVASDGSWVVIAAYGDASLEPVHPGRTPFGVSNPIWMTR